MAAIKVVLALKLDARHGPRKLGAPRQEAKGSPEPIIRGGGAPGAGGSRSRTPD